MGVVLEVEAAEAAVVAVVEEEEVVVAVAVAAAGMSKGIGRGRIRIRRAEVIMIARGDTIRRCPGLVARASLLACELIVVFS